MRAETPPSAIAHLASLRRRARIVIWLERAWGPLGLPLLLLALYALAALARVPQSLPDIVHALFEIALIGTALFTGYRGIRRLERTSDTIIDRRIEHDSRAPFQPLLALTDRPAGLVSTGSDALWARHVERVTATLPPLRVGLPRPPMSATEGAATAAVPLALLAATILAGPHALSRLHAGFLPGVDDDSVPLPQIQAWIDRPSYAPGAPVFLPHGAQTGQITVPEGAILTANITGAQGTPTFRGLSHPDRKRLDAGSWSEHGTLDHSASVSVSLRGRTLNVWKITVEPDLPPVVTWDGTPGADKNGWRTSLPWQVHQHYGVAMLEVEITAPGSLRVLRVPIPLNGQPKDAKGTAQPDLSADAFAGLTVHARLHAKSVSGRESYSSSVTFRIGSRKFSDPLARALVALRHRLLLSQEHTTQALDELGLLAQTTNVEGIQATLGLAIASLQPDAPDGSALRVPGLLWALALYLDDLKKDGPEIADAAAEVRVAQDDVQQQLDRMRDLGVAGQSMAEQEELQKRTQAFKDALNRRMQLLFQRAAQSGIVMPQSGQDSADPWSGEMQRLQSDAAQGNGDEALRRLQQMEDMAEHMRQATPEDLKALAAQMKAQAEARAQRIALHDIVHRETGLLDHTQARLAAARKAAAPPPGQSDSREDISQMSTADLMRQLGVQPPPGMPDSAAKPASAPVDAATVASQSDARKADHAVQHALERVDDVLGRRVKDLTGKDAKSLGKAATDMLSARKALADRHDEDAQAAEERVLADLAEAGKEMKQNQAAHASGSSSGGGLSFIPSMGGGGSGDNQKQAGGRKKDDDDGDQPQAGDDDGSDDDQKDQDPLGRKLGEGNDGKDSDAHIPDKSARDRARDIERELRRRASDRTRPQSELDYLERLLKSF